MANPSKYHSKRSVSLNTNNKMNLNSSFELISLQLTSTDSIEFNKTLETVKKSVMRKISLFIVLAFLTLIVLILIVNQNPPNGTLVLLLYLMGLSISLIIISILTIGENYPYIKTSMYSWVVFLKQRNINGFTKSNLYIYAKSYINKTNPKATHYLSQLYTNEELDSFENPTTHEDRKTGQNHLNLLIRDWYYIDDLRLLLTTEMSIRLIERIYWKFRYALVIVGFTLTIAELYLQFNQNAGIASYVLLGLLFVPLVIFYFAARDDIRIKTQMITRKNVRSLMENKNLIEPSDKLFITLQHYVTKNFPYIDV